MWLKIVIVVLFIGLVISLFTGLGFLLKDREAGDTSSRRTWNALTVRITLAALLIGFIFYGIFTDQLGSNAPWDARYESKLEK
ncbi:twin transmembrane helix small protein [Oceanicoccus sp. KOV_DT_Chl]|uniref:twin transmembrane helix small protein n=1 Tax=Oceanicoccus sp. KOV_DT_Chl TaxID=1904639 RepID=UPI000C7A804B|nr:twin transmembrane helix small protein [Oceanicoccus sp. KOV_DT_Chl]